MRAKQAVKYKWDSDITIVVCSLGTVPKGPEKRPEELETKARIETIQITALLKSARILSRVLETGREFEVAQTSVKKHPRKKLVRSKISISPLFLQTTIVWDYSVNIDGWIRANRPDIIDKEMNHCYIIDMSCPSDDNVAWKTFEKLTKYKNGLKMNYKRTWINNHSSGCRCYWSHQ